MNLLRQIHLKDRAWTYLALVGTVLIRSGDSARSWFLKRTMKFQAFRVIYKSSSLRLAGVFLLCTFINLPIALTRPDLLLVFGPLIYGYFHLVASYYFIQPSNKFIEENTVSKKKFEFFILASFVAILITSFISSFGTITELPHGIWELIAALSMFFFYAIWSKLISKKMIFTVLIINICIFALAWDEPLNFVSATLFIHNWVAFFYWIIIAKDKANRTAAVISTFIFGIIHYLVAMGFLDSVFFIQSENSILAANTQGTAWILSPWSYDPIVGQRALVLYTYGLSAHYFVWLKAIPENRQVKEIPNNFKTSFDVLRKNIGNPMTMTLIAIAVIGSTVWFYSFSLGALIYFTIASIHIWLEVNFLVPRFVAFLKSSFKVSN